MYIKGVYDKFNHTDECMIYNALFDQTLNHNYAFQIRGDQFYGNEEWSREGYDPQDLRTVEVMTTPPPPLNLGNFKDGTK